jgi:FkbM family methyltransferase
MRIGKRSLAEFGRRLLDRNNYKAIPRFFEVHDRPARVLFEEILSLGSYPRTLAIKTPSGPVDVELFSPADLSTLNLIFCRQDYYLPDDTRVVVDVGSNIGLSALYWLTRNNESFVYCYEPAPTSHDRLVANLRPFKDRFVARREAVSNFSGEARFGLETSGVYSSLDLNSSQHVTCQVLHINEVLEPVIRRHGQVDVLKIDSEGHELRTLEAVAPEFWKRIRCINVDCTGGSQFIPPEFHRSRVASAERFWRPLPS